MKANQAAWPVCTMYGLGISPSSHYARVRRGPVSTSSTRCAVERADQGDLERQPRSVRASARPRRAIGRWRAGRAADAPRRDRRRQPHAAKTTMRNQRAARMAPDLVDRGFPAASADQLWVADFTYVRTRTGFSVPGGGAGCVEPPGDGLVDGRPPAHGAGPGCAEHGDLAATERGAPQ